MRTVIYRGCLTPCYLVDPVTGQEFNLVFNQSFQVSDETAVLMAGDPRFEVQPNGGEQ